jgi:hypothetical protein
VQAFATRAIECQRRRFDAVAVRVDLDPYGMMLELGTAGSARAPPFSFARLAGYPRENDD